MEEMIAPLSLGAEHHYALDRMDTVQECLFLTGKAGTGKSTLIQLFKKLSDKKIIFLAPTGVAAAQLKGQTLHSFFKFPHHPFSSKDYKIISKKLLQKIDVICIDEISMVRADLLDHVDSLLRKSMHIDRPFGGIPMIWTGDLFQLPPVHKKPEEHMLFNLYDSPYFFSSNVFSQLKEFEFIELKTIFRQKDISFQRLLQKIRMNDVDEFDLEEINSRYQAEFHDSSDNLTIVLTAFNATADLINSEKLEKLVGEPKIYQAKITGKLIQQEFPADQILILKEGAQIMMIRNDPSKRYVNGSLGIIKGLSEYHLDIALENDSGNIRIERADWEITRYRYEDNEIKTELIGSFSQFPVKLAWAITIHKSQGKTFENVSIDLGRGAFANGQAYVALSRCKTLEGIRLTQKLRWQDIRTDDKVIEFVDSYR